MPHRIWLLVLLMFLAGCAQSTTELKEKTMTTSIYEIPIHDENGKETNLKAFQGQVLLVVNVASKCGYTSQYEQLEEIYQQYKSQGFTVLGFPSNDFGEQEPGSMKEIKQFCTLTYGVTFPIFEKLHARGNEIHPLYQHLTSTAPQKGEVAWNFEKFLLNKKGEVVARFESGVKPDDAVVTKAIEEELSK